MCDNESAMPFVARASRSLPVSAAVAFDRLADHDSWASWMPPSFRPLEKAPVGRLTEGLQLRVKISGTPFPVSLRVRTVRRPAEICWSGGVKGLLHGDHRFSFEATGEASVEVRSDETWSGFFATLMRPGILPKAEQIGRDQLEALAAAVGSGRRI
jgi:hypothetical protein